MAKEAFYFSHDSNARSDPKMMQMRSVYKSEGVGWYWMFIEMMRDQEDYRLPINGKYICNAYAKEFDADAVIMQKFINDCVDEFKLFETDGEYIWANTLKRRMQYKKDISEVKRQAALKRWGTERETVPKKSTCNAHAPKKNAYAMPRKKGNKGKKVKESKRKETTLYQFIEQELKPEFTDLNIDEEFKKFELYWSEGERRLKRPKTAFRNWLTKAREFKNKDAIKQPGGGW